MVHEIGLKLNLPLAALRLTGKVTFAIHKFYIYLHAVAAPVCICILREVAWHSVKAS